jgi:hypothetical protein
MRKEYTVTNDASGVDLYPKGKFDSNKTIGVSSRESACTRTGATKLQAQAGLPIGAL